MYLHKIDVFQKYQSHCRKNMLFELGPSMISTNLSGLVILSTSWFTTGSYSLPYVMSHSERIGRLPSVIRHTQKGFKFALGDCWVCTVFNVYFMAFEPDKMAKWVEHPSHVLGDRRIWTSQVQTLVKSNKWPKNWYLSLPSQALCIIRIRKGLGGTVSG